MTSTHAPRLTVGRSLALGFSIVILLGALIAVLAGIKLQGMSKEVQILAHQRMANVQAASRIKDNMSLQAMAVRGMLLIDDATRLQAEKNQIDELRADTGAQFKMLEKSLTIPRVREILQQAHNGRDAYNQAASLESQSHELVKAVQAFTLSDMPPAVGQAPAADRNAPLALALSA